MFACNFELLNCNVTLTYHGYIRFNFNCLYVSNTVPVSKYLCGYLSLPLTIDEHIPMFAMFAYPMDKFVIDLPLVSE